FLGCVSGQAKAYIVEKVRLLTPGAARRAAVITVVVPASAPVDPARAVLRTCWVSHFAGRILRVPVAAPLPDVAVHVEKTQRVILHAARSETSSSSWKLRVIRDASFSACVVGTRSNTS